MNRIKQHLFEIETFSNIINIFPVTLDKFNAYLLDQNNNSYLKKQQLLVTLYNNYTLIIIS